MGYKLIELELSGTLSPVVLERDQFGLGVIARWKGCLIGFHMAPYSPGETITPERLRRLADTHFAHSVLSARVSEVLPLGAEAPATGQRPSLSIAICTKDRALRLARLLDSLASARRDPTFRAVETIVVDNASVDQSTRDAVSRFPGVRYVLEPRTGLNFARNAALAAATGDLIAYLDDDVTVDGDWQVGLAEAWRSRTDAGGFTGLVLPLRLDTDAQLLFEGRGGFGRGFERLEYRGVRQDNPLFPAGAGAVGAGCNMAFDRELLIKLGGFDEALDTGAPLPGGGDLDIFYRVLRSGRPMVYEPRYAVYHEHRETIPQLRRQYWSWGLGMMAFLVKSRRSDPEFKPVHSAMVRWWFADQIRALARALIKRDGAKVRFTLAELQGGVAGLFGEYDRSVARVDAIRQAAK